MRHSREIHFGFPGLRSEVNGIFNNRSSPSATGRQSRAIAKAYMYCFGNVLDSPEQQFESGLLMPGFGAVSVQLLRGKHCQHKWGDFI